jgi:hypothetical protein
MKIKKKTDVFNFLNSCFIKLNSGQYSFYFYDQERKKHSYIINDGSSYILKSICTLSNTSETKQIEDIDDFIWNNRKYINKEIGKPAYVHHFCDLKQYY